MSGTVFRQKILVAGATGVIGRRVVPLLLARGHAVTAVGRSRERLAELARQGATTATLDLFDRDAVRRGMDGHDAVVNLATHVPAGARVFLPGAWAETARLRSVASAVLAEAAVALGVPRVVQESIALTYPDSGARWVDETVAPRPARYNRSALDAEASARRVTEAGGAGVALRFALLYGGAEDGFTRDVLRAVARGWLPIFGAPAGYVPLVTHDDAARAVVAALGVPAGVYNVVDDEPLTRRALGDALAAVLGVRPPTLPPAWAAALGGSLGETIARSLRVSNRKLRGATGWAPHAPSGREGWRAACEAIADGAGRRPDLAPHAATS